MKDHYATADELINGLKKFNAKKYSNDIFNGGIFIVQYFIPAGANGSAKLPDFFYGVEEDRDEVEAEAKKLAAKAGLEVYGIRFSKSWTKDDYAKFLRSHFNVWKAAVENHWTFGSHNDIPTTSFNALPKVEQLRVLKALGQTAPSTAIHYC